MAGRAAEKLSRNDEAIGFYERLLARTAVDEFVGKGHYQLAFLLRGEAAERNLSRYRERFPTAPLAPEMTLALAESRFAAGDMAGAEKAYTELAEAPAAPAKVRTAATYGLGWCLLRQERLADADARFAAVAAPAPEAGEALVRDAVRQRGEIAYRQERFPEAEALFARLRDDPGHGERALYMLGWCARKRQAEDEAAAAFRLVLERYPKGEFAADSGLRLGEALNDKGLSAEARTVLAAARDRDPPPALAEPILLELGEAEVALEDWPAVRATAERFAERFPQSARAYLAPFRLGLACQGLGLLDEAEKHFRDTIAATETIEAARAQFNLGAIQFSRQQYLEAAKAFLRVEMLYDYEDLAPRSLYHAALSFQRAGDSKRAELYRARLLEKHPDSEWARKPLGEEGK
jgi:TolA-binding protein